MTLLASVGSFSELAATYVEPKLLIHLFKSLMRRTLLALCSVCIGFPASSTQAMLDCNLAGYRHALLVAFEERTDQQGGWYCGYPRNRAAYDVRVHCGKSE